MYNWKTTIGDVDARTPLWNTWGYNTTQGLGFHEYLQLCEDLGAQSLFDINDGMSLQDSVPLSRMGQWTQDALDAIEYANGPANSVWGALRAKAGHPAPFNLRYMEIGNENGGPDYHQRWALLVNAIRQKYPDMQLIVNTDLRGRPYPRNPKPDIITNHPSPSCAAPISTTVTTAKARKSSSANTRSPATPAGATCAPLSAKPRS
jgi:alpha-L-arabinofuranosidase